MIEKILFDYLSNALSVPIYTERPEKHPAEYVLFEVTGGYEPNKLNRATVAVQFYGKTLFAAASRAHTDKDIILNAVQLPEISAVHLNQGPYNFTNTAMKEYRYQAVFEITYY